MTSLFIGGAGRALRAVALTAVFCLGLLASLVAVAQAAPPNARYVSFGDSFTSNPPLLTSIENFGGDCRNGPDNYPRLVDGQVGDYSCNGTNTHLMLARQIGDSIRAESLGEGTAKVSLMVGYMDNWGTKISQHYGTLAAFCVVTQCRDLSAVAPKLSADEFIVRLAQSMELIHAYAPNAEVVFLSYPTLTTRGDLCLPLGIPVPSGFRTFERTVTSMISAAAHHYGATFVDVNAESIGHGPCDADPWTNTLTSNGLDLPLHSAQRGQAEIARILAPYIL